MMARRECFDIDFKYACDIAQIDPVSFPTSILHGSLQVVCTLQRSLSGHQHGCISYSQEDIIAATEEDLKWKTFPA